MTTRRDFMKMVSAGAAGAMLPGLVAAENASPKTSKLNLLFLMTDQHHWNVMGCAGNSVVKTPNLDRLARGGVRFTHAFVPVPYCSPTRMAIETGLYPGSLGLGRNIDKSDDPLRLREPRRVYQHALAAAGYKCFQLGKWHLGDPAELQCLPSGSIDAKAVGRNIRERIAEAGDKAFDDGPRAGEAEKVGDVFLRDNVAVAHRRWRSEKNTPKQDVGVIGRSRVKPEYTYESVLADKCIELMKEHKDESFAITYSVSPPHAPWVAPARFYDMYDPEKLPLPTTWGDRPRQWADSASARMCAIYGEAGFREYLRCYYAQVTMMDWCIGRILDALEELKLAEKTLVIFTSDHGNMLGQHGMMDKSVGAFYDDLMRVPLLMRLPGVIPQGMTCDAFAKSVDLPSTVFDYLGAEPMPGVHGRSLRDVIAGKAGGDKAVFGERGDIKTPRCARMIRTRQWKLCLQPNGVHELYDMVKDPEECSNVYRDPANSEVVSGLKEQLRAHMAAVGDQAEFGKLVKSGDGV